ncbi:hypothetical protein HY732_04505 [Candidatus Uhrbacteria bacterium]|nr:hypothetical protein [Candidatus Uhrbacteria bacterium]
MSHYFRFKESGSRPSFFAFAGAVFFLCLAFFPQSAFAQNVNPGQEGPAGDVGVSHLLEVLKQSGVNPAADASKFNGIVKIGGSSESYRGVLEIGNRAVEDLSDIQRTIGNNAIVINSPTYRANQYFPGLVWSAGIQAAPKPKMGIWGQMTNTGSKMYFGTSSNSDIGITNQAMTIDQDGRVGIGTPSPKSMLHLYNTTSTELRVEAVDGVNDRSAKLSLRGSGNGGALAGGAIIDFTDSDGTPGTPGSLTFQKNGAPYMTILNGGSVGIGTTSPVSPLTLYNFSNVGPKLTLAAPGGGSPGIDFRPYHNESQWSNPAQASIAVIDNNWSADIHFATKIPGSLGNALVDRMVIRNDGNVGIGTTTPGATLDVVGTIRSLTAPGNVPYYRSKSTNHASEWGFGTQDDDSFAFWRIPNGGSWSELMRINSSGMLGIGTGLQVGRIDAQGSTEYYIGGHAITMKGLKGDDHLPYLQMREENGARAFYLGWGSKTNKRVDWNFENGYNLAINGNVGISGTLAAGTLAIADTLRFGSSYLTSRLSQENQWQRFMLGYGINWDQGQKKYVVSDPTDNRSTFSNENGTFVWAQQTGGAPATYSYSDWHANNKMVLSPDGTLSIANNLGIGGVQYSGTPSARRLNNVAVFSEGGESQTGVIVIQTTVPQDSSTMINLKINLYGSYREGGKAIVEINTGGYWTPQNNSGLRGAQTNNSNYKYRVRYARNKSTGNVAVIIGETNSVWPYPKVAVTEVLAGHGWNDAYGNGWTISRISDLSGYENMVDVPETTTAYNLSGGSVAATTGTFSGQINAGNSDLYFTKTDHNHTGIGNTSGFAAIENAQDYGALMILGRATSSGRIVKLWDYLQVNGNLGVTGSIDASTIYTDNWFRSNGNTGWYSQTYGGGWYMSDTSWIRTYNEKNVWTGTGLLGSGGGLTVGYGGQEPNTSGGAIIAGSVGIGTTATDIAGVVHKARIKNSTDGRVLALDGTNWSGLWWAVGGLPRAAIDVQNDGSMTFWTNPDGVLNSWSQRAVIAADGRVGIGTTDPKAKLHVNGPIFFNDASGNDTSRWGMYVWNDQLQFSVRNKNQANDWSWQKTPIAFDIYGNLFLGTTITKPLGNTFYIESDNRAVALWGSGHASFRGTVEVGGWGDSPNENAIRNYWWGMPIVFWLRSSNGGWNKPMSINPDGSVDVWGALRVRGQNVGPGGGMGSGTPSQWTSIPNGIYYNDKVGIGTSNPTFAGSSIHSPSGIELSNSAPEFRITRTNSGARSYGLEIDSNGSFYINDDTAGAGHQRLAILTNGNVGIGTNLPGRKFEVYGGSADTFIHVDSNNGYSSGIEFAEQGYGNQADPRLKWGIREYYNGRDDIFRINPVRDSVESVGITMKASNGYVGILNTNPNTYLTVGPAGGVNGSGNLPGISMRSNPWTFMHYSVGQDDTHNVFLKWVCGSNKGPAAYCYEGNLSYGSLSTYGGNGNLILQEDGGNVGIGKKFRGGAKAPQFELDVDGSVNVAFVDDKKKLAMNDSSFGMDVAELFDATEEVEEGDVLAVSGEGKKVKRSTKEYQQGLMGVVSSAPAVLFEGSELKLAPDPDRFIKGTKPPVTLAGRVLVKVNNENGAIQPGDYLTSSSVPGVAMKATEPGPTIGIALDSFNGIAQGKVLVFVNVGENNVGTLVDEVKKIKDSNSDIQKRLDMLERGSRKTYW